MHPLKCAQMLRRALAAAFIRHEQRPLQHRLSVHFVQALERLQTKMDREGVDRELLARRVRLAVFVSDAKRQQQHTADTVMHELVCYRQRVCCDDHPPRLRHARFLPMSAQRYIKPHLARQRNAKDAVFNAAKRQRVKLVEEMLLDPRMCPF